MGIRAALKRGLRYIVKGIPVVKVEVNISQITMPELLKDRCIIITGGGRGLGFYMAKKCVELGADVLITGRNEQTLLEACQKLGEKCHYLVFDVSDTDRCEEFLNHVQKVFNDKKIDTLINNAGISLHEGEYSKVTEKSWDTQFNTNLKGSYFLTQKYIEYLLQKEKSEGNILFITSERGLYCDDIPYGLTKAGIVSLTRGLARRLIKHNIRVNAIAPGVTVSDMTGYKRDGDLYRESLSGKRIYLPEEVAEVAAFLLSDASKCISGEVIACDQGNYLRCDW